ncbi:ATP-binding protein [Albidovulum sediminicola]|uniref:histidine kinase n=1 Tax=Albidovulum sediminicola TaxID=2984331 RepID=A0ABT2YZM3_9RHOB|nr:ATP-binding protein [Defluviimonas sp. WL0075]MCV2864312.1 ATP-binding protein [Defluviimonas sp. WL0075]
MTREAWAARPAIRRALEGLSRASIPLAGGVVLSFLAYLTAGTFAGLACLTGAATLLAIGLAVFCLDCLRAARDARLAEVMAAFVAQDRLASFTEGADGAILARNGAAQAQFGAGGRSMSEVLGAVMAAPAPVLRRLRQGALLDGSAAEEVVTARGPLRICLHRAARTLFIWRIEAVGADTSLARPGDGGGLPMMAVSAAGSVVFMNDALRQLLGARISTLADVFSRLPVQGGDIQEVQTSYGRRRFLIAEVTRPNQPRQLYLVPVPSEIGGKDDRGLGGAATLPVALVLLSRAGALIEANPAARMLIGEVPEGTPLNEILEGLGQPVNDWIADALTGRAEGRPEVLRLRNPEADAYLQVTLSRTLTPEGTALIAILSDATQLKTLEAQFVQSQKMQAIGQLAGGIAHDFNNLLTAITGHCDLLLLRHRQSDPDYADLIQINQNANRAASLVGQLLAFSRKQTLKSRVLDLRETLADLAHLLNRLVGENIRLVLRNEPDLHPIRADRRQLEQVIMNLVVNARDAMARGGTIRITTENIHLQEEMRRERATVPAGDYVLVSVADEGTGIAPDKMSKIFEPFFTTKRQGEGTGLGLSMAYGIVKQTGGFIFCQSSLGTGTTFRLYFPAYTAKSLAEPEPAEAAPPAPPPLRRGGATVLLVEDEAPVRAFAARALKMRGFAVFEADCAEAALSMLEDKSLSIDIFVTDVIMPGLDGPTWVRKALADRPDTRVVFVSGYAEESIAETRDRVPNSTFLPKPFSLNDLVRTVQEQLGQAQSARDGGGAIVPEAAGAVEKPAPPGDQSSAA